jgi:hypothetical protein
VSRRATHTDLPTTGPDQQTRWVPTRYRVPTSRVIWQRGKFRLHQSAVRLLVVSALLVIVPTIAGLLIEPPLMSPTSVAVAYAMAWAFTLSFLHHELAHALVARRHGIETLAMGFHGNGAYVRFRRTSTAVPPHAWVRILAAGPVSNAVVGSALLAGWLATGAGLSDPLGLFFLLAGVMELVWAAATGVPVRDNDGREIVDALRLSRSPGPT